jgi:pyridoxal phosphate enzyme (YggS family)
LTAAERLAAVRERIAAAARRAGRAADDVELVAVAKYATAESVVELARAGQRVFGENHVQDAIPKMAAASMALPEPLQWHMIGHLQRNKVRQAIGPFAMIESLDSTRLANAISERAHQEDVDVRVLLEVNIDRDPAKFGFTPEAVMSDYPALRRLPGLVIEGLMTIGAVTATPEAARPTFSAMRALRKKLDAVGAGPRLRHLSMGMSADYQVAIEEGATIVRVGTALFGSHHR